MYVAGPTVFAARGVRGETDGSGGASAGGDGKEQHREGHQSFLLGMEYWVLASLIHL